MKGKRLVRIVAALAVLAALMVALYPRRSGGPKEYSFEIGRAHV